MSTEYMSLQGKKIPYFRGVVQVETCELDAKNPRLQYLVGQRAGMVSENELDDLIWAKDAVKALAQSILQNAGVYDPIIVQRNGERYRVREGNCRTVACRHLLDQFPNDGRFSTMPAMIFDVDLTEEDLAVLLADMHVTGKIRWDAYEQAKHVSDLFNVYGKTYEWLSTHLRLSKSKIKELLEAHRATTEYLIANPSPTNVRKFSFFHELMRKKEIRDRFLNEPSFKQQFQCWVRDERIADAKQVRDIPRILESPDSLKALDTKGFEEAIRILMQNDPSLESNLFWAVKNATEELKKAPASDIQDLKSGNVNKILMLRNLYRAVDDLATLAGVKL